jgi:hypothetical protein
MASIQCALRTTCEHLMETTPVKEHWAYLLNNAYVVTLRDTPSITIQARPTPESITALMAIVQFYDGEFELKYGEIGFEMPYKTPYTEPSIRLQIYLM